MASLRIFLVLSLSFALGCSSSLFTGDRKNDANLGDGNFNKDCIGIDLSQKAITAEAAKKLTHCLNLNGAIQQYEDLLNSLDDRALSAILKPLNVHVLGNPERFKEIDQSYARLNELGLVDQGLTNLTKVLDNQNLIPDAIRSFRELEITTDDFLQVIQILAQELNRDHVARALEVGLGTSKFQSYNAIINGLRSLNASNAQLTLIIDKLLVYIKNKIHDDKHALAKTLLWGLRDSTAFKAFDHYYTQSCEGVAPNQCDSSKPHLSSDYQVLALEGFIKLISRDRPDILKQSTKLFRMMNAPVYCMERTKAIPNANLMVLNEFLSMDPLEVPQWVARTNSLKIQMAASICEFPKEPSFNQMMWALREMAQEGGHNTLVTVSHLVRGLQIGQENPLGGTEPNLRQAIRHDIGRYLPEQQESQRYWRFLFDWLGDDDVYDYLNDTTAELSRPERRVMGNLFYFMNALDEPTRDSFRYAIDVLLKARVELSGRSVLDVFSNASLNLQTKTVVSLLSDLSAFIDSKDDLAPKLMTLARDSLLSNNVNPFLSLARTVSENALDNKELFNSLMEIADKKTFIPALALTSKMAKNGSLKLLIETLLSMLRNNGKTLPNPVNTDIPALKQPDLSKDTSTETTGTWVPHTPRWDGSSLSVCSQLDFDIAITKPSQSPKQWAKLITDFGNCIVSIRDCQKDATFCKALPSAIRYGLSHYVDGNKSALAFLTELLADFLEMPDLSKEKRQKTMHEFGDLLTNQDSFKKILDLHQGLKFLFGKTYCPGKIETCQNEQTLAVVQALTKALTVFKPTDFSNIQQVLDLAAFVIENKHAPVTAPFLYDLAQTAKKMPPPVASIKPAPFAYPIQNFPLNTKIKNDLVAKIAAIEPPADGDYEKVVAQKVNDYWNSLRSGERFFGYSNIDEFKASLKRLLDKLAEPRMFEALFTFFFSVDLSPYSPEWVESWFQRLSSELQVIEYYYPGPYAKGMKPSVRLVNMLDLLELIVFDADFSPIDYGQSVSFDFDNPHFNADENFALKHLSRLGQLNPDKPPIDAYMDMFRWILDIEGELSTFTAIKDKLEWVSNWVADKAMVPEIRRRTFNMGQVVGVLRKMIASERIQGKRIQNDLGFLRDLFRAVLRATPEDKQNIYHRDVNSIALVAEIVRLGIIHLVGLNTWTINEDGRIVAAEMKPILTILRDLVIKRYGSNHFLNHDTVEIVKYLLRENCKKEPGKACRDFEKFDDRYVLIGKLVNKYFEWTKQDNCQAKGAPCVTAALKQTAYYGLSLLGKLQEQGLMPSGLAVEPPRDFAHDLMHISKPVVLNYSDFLTDEIDRAAPVITSFETGNFIRLLYLSATQPTMAQQFHSMSRLSVDTVHQMAETHSANAAMSLLKTILNDHKQRFEAAFNVSRRMAKDPELEPLGIKELFEKIIHWLPQDSALRERMQAYGAEHLRNGDVAALLKFIATESTNDQLYSATKFLGDPEVIIGLQDFLRLLRNGLEDIYNVSGP